MIINDILPMISRPTINDFLLYGLAWLIILVGHFFLYFIWCGFQSKKVFVFDIILFYLSLASVKYLVENKNKLIKNAGRLLVNEKMKKNYSIDNNVIEKIQR